jgi:glutaredoxin 2
MALELYHYVHCPYCIRVRMALGYLKLPWSSHVLPYNDEKTPLRLSGKKMLPIIVIDGKAHNESLDIIALLDKSEKLKTNSWGETDLILNELGQHVHNLGMPYWVWSPEFDQASRDYFIAKKSAKRGPFNELARRRNEFEAPLHSLLEQIEPQLSPYWNSTHLTVKDIALASHVWGLFAVPEFHFSQPWYDYLMKIKLECEFDYHRDFWVQA